MGMYGNVQLSAGGSKLVAVTKCLRLSPEGHSEENGDLLSEITSFKSEIKSELQLGMLPN